MTRRKYLSSPVSPPATFLLSVFFGLQGFLYLLAVAYAAWRLGHDDPDRASVAIPGLTIGFFVALSFIYASFLLRRGKRSGLKWVAVPLVAIAAQWLFDLELPPGQLLTFFISLIGVTAAWFELTRHDSYHSHVDH